MKKVKKGNDIAIYWPENKNPFFLICPWQGVHFKLILELSKLGRTDDIVKAAADKEYQEKLLKEFDL